jgi:hypothetical protein
MERYGYHGYVTIQGDFGLGEKDFCDLVDLSNGGVLAIEKYGVDHDISVAQWIWNMYYEVQLFTV